jgi:hypothetical protein
VTKVTVTGILGHAVWGGYLCSPLEEVVSSIDHRPVFGFLIHSSRPATSPSAP